MMIQYIWIQTHTHMLYLCHLSLILPACEQIIISAITEDWRGIKITLPPGSPWGQSTELSHWVLKVEEAEKWKDGKE